MGEPTRFAQTLKVTAAIAVVDGARSLVLDGLQVVKFRICTFQHAPESMELTSDEVHVWLAEPPEVRDPSLLAAYDALMSPAERARQRRYFFERDRLTCLLTRALVRTTLSRYVAGKRPEDWRFAANEYGKPSLFPGQCSLPLRFNLSHTEGLIACAVTLSRNVGVDVEWLDRRGETVSIADRFFSPEEARALRALPETEQRDRFFHYWTLKESYIKARGMGLAIPLDQFSFRIDRDTIALHVERQLGDDPARWRFAVMKPKPRHVLALCAERPLPVRVTCRFVTPLAGMERQAPELVPGKISRR